MNRRRGIVLKSRGELEAMREAGRINARALAAAVSLVQPGVTTAAINEAAAEVLRSHGAIPAFVGVPGVVPYPAETTISVNDELVHGIPGSRQLIDGDIVSIDCGTVYEGFVGDSAITVAVGEVSEEASRLLRVTCESLFLGMDRMRVGNRTGDVSTTIQAHVEENGFQVVREYTGHGVGREMHEDPQVPNYGQAGKGTTLRPGMTIALEPMVLAGEPETRVLGDHWTVSSSDGRLTAHFEHTVAVTENGPWVLTAGDDDLDEDIWNRYNYYFAGSLEPEEGKAR